MLSLSVAHEIGLKDQGRRERVTFWKQNQTSAEPWLSSLP